MLQSMTGFATKAFTLTAPNGEKSNISMSLKSLNSRYFEATYKLPSAISALETKFNTLFKKKLRRGHIYFTVYVSNPDIFKGVITPALNTINAYADAITQIKNQLNIKQDVSLEHILQLRNIFNIEEKSVDEESAKIILAETNNIIDTVITVRTQEGMHLKTDIEKRIDTIHNAMTEIEKNFKTLLEQHKEKVHATLQEIGADESILAEAQKNALYTMLDKIDIQEEITRFQIHTNNLAQHLQSDKLEKGKKLDFILQELGREVNTIAAKCSDSTISSHAINIKVEIEKIREQVQNIV